MDIGPGDVVEAIGPVFYCMPNVARGDRAVVRLVVCGDPIDTCVVCGRGDEALILAEFRAPDGMGFCPCNWRKIGGSRADTVRRFAEDLNVRPIVPAFPLVHA